MNKFNKFGIALSMTYGLFFVMGGVATHNIEALVLGVAHAVGAAVIAVNSD